MKKRLFLLLIGAMMLCMMTSVSATAPNSGIVTPLWDNISSAAPTINFIGTNGYASAVIAAKAGTTEINASLAVYKQVGNDWEYVDHDSGRTTSSLNYGLNVNFQGEPGAYYKAVLNMTVTKNGVAENEILFAYATCPKGT